MPTRKPSTTGGRRRQANGDADADGGVQPNATKAGMVAEVLRHEIAVGSYPPGSDLPSEARISARFGTSRPSSREALRILESEGLIRVSRGARGGAKVLLPTYETIARHVGMHLQLRDVPLMDLFDVLLLYEPLAARMIALRRDPTALSELAQCAAAQEYSTHDREEFGDHERRFRRLLLKHSGNVVIDLMGSILSETYERALYVISRSIPDPAWQGQHLTSGVDAKKRLIKLMAEGDADGARRLWEIYLRVYWKRLRSHGGTDSNVTIHSLLDPPKPPQLSAPAPDAAASKTPARRKSPVRRKPRAPRPEPPG